MSEIKIFHKNRQTLKENYINTIVPKNVCILIINLLLRKQIWIPKKVVLKYKWKYIWSHSSGIHVRKNDGDATIKIQSIGELKKTR